MKERLKNLNEKVKKTENKKLYAAEKVSSLYFHDLRCSLFTFTKKTCL